MRLNKIKRAIISVSNKSNLDLLLPTLKKFKIEIICSGGTFKYIKKRKYKCINLKSFTNFPEILDGRVKTIHPKLYGGILNMRNNSKHKKECNCNILLVYPNQIPKLDYTYYEKIFQHYSYWIYK